MKNETWNEFLVNFGLMQLTIAITFAIYILTKTGIQRKWSRKLNSLEFGLLLSLAVILSQKIQHHFIP